MNNNCMCKNQCRCEYGREVPAGIRNIAPSCKDKAVIPSVTVERIEGMKGLSDCFVHVTTTNTTYYIDDKGRTTIIWAGPVEEDNYQIEENPRKLRSQLLIDFENNRAVYYNAVGNYRTFTLTPPSRKKGV